MANDVASTVLNRLLDPVTQCLTPEAARRLLELRADPILQEHIDQLAEKSTAGTLSAEELSEYETYISASTVIAILQAKARDLLTPQTAA